MSYVGLQTQIWRNNTRSILLLVAFPVLLLLLTWLGGQIYFLGQENASTVANESFVLTAPIVCALIGVWFIIAWFSHSSMIAKATKSKSITRKQAPNLYNLLENLCISKGVAMPKLRVIKDNSLNAFASGLNQKDYTITVSTGLVAKLNDEEMEGVLAHELTHIINRDVRLLVVTVIFVGIFAFLTEILAHLRFSGKKDGGKLMLIVLLLGAIGYFFSSIFRMALSRKREYLADAGAAEMTKNPRALASALRKVSLDSRIEAVERRDVAQMFIENPLKKNRKNKTSFISRIYATHPPIEKRIEILEQL